jgi:hypothetical protein
MRFPHTIAMLATLTALGASGCDDDGVNSPPPPVVDLEPPPIPSGVYSVTGDGEVTVYWSPLIGADVRGYNVYVSESQASGYQPIARLYGEETDHYVATGLENGLTLYFAVDAFDFDGNTSDLSSSIDQFVHDTPRPSGTGLNLYPPETDQNNAAVDWSEYPFGNAAMSVAFDDTLADYVVVRVGSVLYLRGTMIAGYPNDIQDFGYTSSLDEVDWAPDLGWSQTQEVELIQDHSYIAWTWDDYYLKFRVTAVGPSSVTLEWAYQATEEYDFRYELKLAPGRKKAQGA